MNVRIYVRIAIFINNYKDIITSATSQRSDISGTLQSTFPICTFDSPIQLVRLVQPSIVICILYTWLSA